MHAFASRLSALTMVLSICCLPVAAAQSGVDAAGGQAAVLGQTRQEQGLGNPHPRAQWFPDAGLGLFIHWGIASVQARGDLSWCMLANKPWYDGTIVPNEYYRSIEDWKPDRMDYDRMLGAARGAGFTYAVLVTKHHDGFALWPSVHGDLGTKHSLGGRDFVREYVEACHRHGLKVGLYYSPPDWWFDRQYRSWAVKGPALDMDHQPGPRPRKPADHDRKRAELVRNQVTELLSNYGRIDLLWFDGGRGEIANAEVRRLQPGIVINRRNGEPGDYGDSEGGLPGKRFQGWFESCVTCWPMRKWSYSPDYPHNDAALTLTALVVLRSWGGNLLANVGPMGDGTVPPEAFACWTDMAKWMAHSGESIHGVRPGPWPEDANLPVSLASGAAYVYFLPRFPEKIAGLPAGERNFTRIRDIIKPLPEYTDDFTWRGGPQPVKVTLLRTGAEIPFRHRDGVLEISLPGGLRSGNVDVVKVWLTPATTPKLPSRN